MRLGRWFPATSHWPLWSPDLGAAIPILLQPLGRRHTLEAIGHGTAADFYLQPTEWEFALIRQSNLALDRATNPRRGSRGP